MPVKTATTRISNLRLNVEERERVAQVVSELIAVS